MTVINAVHLTHPVPETLLPEDQAAYFNAIYQRRFVTIVSVGCGTCVARQLNGTDVEIGADCLLLTRCTYCNYGYSAHAKDGKCCYGPGYWLDRDAYLRNRVRCSDYS